MSSKGGSVVASEQDQERGLVPKLRFPEFREAEEWKFKALSELLSEPKKRNRNLKYGPEDVLSVSGEHGCVNQIEFMGRSYAGVSVKDYHVVETGDVVYTKSPLKVAPYGIIKANKGRSGIVSTLYAVYRPTKKSRPDYIDHYFSRNYNLNSYLQPIVKKGAKNDMKVKNSDVLTGGVWVPNIDEQQKIADFLSSIDALIAAETDKLDALKDHKKGLMQQLFPAPGETIPQLRFPEFRDAGDWEEKALSQVCDINPTNPPLPEIFFYIDLESVETGKLKKKRVVIKSDAPLRAQRVMKNNDILFQMVRPYQKNNFLFDRADGDYVASTGYAQLRVSQGSPAYLYQAIHADGFVNRVIEKCSGSNYPAISSSDLANTPLPAPSSTEQQKIADCLSSLDTLITAQSDRIDVLKLHKEGLMQQLFPVADGVGE